MTANGHVFDRRPRYPFAMTAQLLLGVAGGRVADVSDRAGPPFPGRTPGRGLAAGDLDNDGRIDFLMVAQDEPLVFFHNKTAAGHFDIAPPGGTQVESRWDRGSSHRDLRRPPTAGQRCGGGSYQSADDPACTSAWETRLRADAIEVRWPSGRVDRIADLPADSGYLFREGESKAIHLKGWEASPNAANPK